MHYTIILLNLCAITFDTKMKAPQNIASWFEEHHLKNFKVSVLVIYRINTCYC